MKDVVIIGGGVVGLFSAILLGQRGLSVAIYERWSEVYPRPRACTIDHEGVRLLQAAGLIDEMQALLDPVIGDDKNYEFVDKSEETLLRIDWNRPGASGWAQVSFFHQPDLERIFLKKLAQLSNVEIHYGEDLFAITQAPDHVELSFNNKGSSAACRVEKARYVIGADGARSTVRDLMGISQTDLGFAYDWLVVDVVPHAERVWKPYVVQHCDPARPCTSVGSGPGRRRWEFMRLPTETIDELNTVEKAWELIAPWNMTPENASIERHTVYTFRGTWADSWRNGRVLIAGDAAHLMPPFLAQGLCSGMRDAAALAWRLPLILGGQTPESLLDSYETERSPHVQEIIRQAVEIGRIICVLDPLQAAERDSAMKAAMSDPALALKPPPEPRLGAGGVVLPGDVNAGYLSIQGRVSRDGMSGLFDDVVGKGWQLISKDAAMTRNLDSQAIEVLNRLDVVSATFGPGGDTLDLDGTYRKWLDKANAEIALIRPDFYVFGTGRASETSALLISAWNAVQGSTKPEIRGRV